MGEQLVNEIIANPTDISARLVYADWLEERGNDLGEFIRVQCQIEETDERDPGYTDLLSREMQLKRQHNKEWAAAVRPFVRNWSFRNGMVDHVCMTALDFLNHGAEIFKLAPIQHLELRDAYKYLSDLSESRLLKNLRRFSLAHCSIGRGGNPGYGEMRWERDAREQVRIACALELEKFLRSPNLKQIENLDLCGNSIGNSGGQAIVNAELENLKSLDIRLGHVGAEAVESFTKLRKLEDLKIGSSRNMSLNYSEDWIGPLPLELAKLIGQLKSLDAGSCGITPNGLNAINQTKASKLESLSLNRSPFYKSGYLEADVGVDVLSDAQMLAKLKHLDVSNCGLDQDAFEILANRSFELPLKSLIVDYNQFKPEVSKTFANGRATQALTSLSLAGARRYQYEPTEPEHGTKWFIELVDGLEQLAELKLNRQGITDKILDGESTGEKLKRFYHLDLQNNEIGDTGAKKFIKLGPWPRLAILNLKDNQLSKPVKEELRKTFGWRVLF